jgi:hypothetical protein
VFADFIERDAVVGLCDGPGKARAGRGKRLETEMLQRACAADIEGIWNRKTTGFMHLPECRALLCC